MKNALDEIIDVSSIALENRLSKEKEAIIAGQCVSLFNNANTVRRQNWITKMIQCVDFFEDEQLSQEEIRELTDARMPTFTVNRITPAIDMMRYFVTANNPAWVAKGVEVSDIDKAEPYIALLRHSWKLSGGTSVNGFVVLDSFIRGVGYWEIYVDKFADNGMGEVLFGRLQPEEVIVDPQSKDFLYRDAKFIQVVCNTTKTALALSFPNLKEKINAASGQQITIKDETRLDKQQEPDTPNPIDGEAESLIGLYRTYRKIKVKLVTLEMRKLPTSKDMQELLEKTKSELSIAFEESKVKFLEYQYQIEAAIQSNEITPERGIVELKKQSFIVKNEYDKTRKILMEKIEEITTETERKVVSFEEYKLLLKDPFTSELIINAQENYEDRIWCTITLGEDTTLYDEVLDWKYYPIIPLPYLYTGNTLPISAVKPVIGKQREINKSHQLLIHHANLSANLRYMAEYGMITDDDDWTRNATTPSGIMKFTPGVKLTRPEVIMPTALNNAFYQVVQDGKLDIEYSLGISVQSMGMQPIQDEPFRTTMARDEFTTRRLKEWVNSILQPALEHVGNVYFDIAKTVYKSQKAFRISAPNPPYGDKVYTINQLSATDSGKYETLFSIEEMQYDIEIVSGSTFPIDKDLLEAKMFNYFKNGIMDDIAFLPFTNIPKQTELLERKSLYAQMKMQIDQLAELLKQYRGDNETLKRQIMQSEISRGIDESSLNIKKAEIESKGNIKSEGGMSKKDKKKS